MLDAKQLQIYRKQFSGIEASFRIEGMDPSGDAVYEQAKAAVLAGETTPKQALEFAVEQTAAEYPQPVAAIG